MDPRSAFYRRAARVQRRAATYEHVAVLILLLLFFGRLVSAAAQQSVTFDEVLHIFQGVLYWRHEQLFAVVRNPPLINALIGLPVQVALQPALPPDLARYAHQDWLAVSKQFMWEVNGNGLQLVWVGRLAVMSLAMLLGALVYRWSRSLFGSPLPALLTLALYTLDPNILAHSFLATTDVGMAFFLLLAAYLVWRYWRHDRFAWWRYLAAGVAIGALLATKFSGVVIVPGLIVIGFLRLLQTRRAERSLAGQAARAALEVGGWLLLGGFTLQAVYRFQVGTLQLDWALQQAHQLGGHSAYLLGEISTEGWWYYFPLVFLVKTPLPVLVLLVLGFFYTVRYRRFDWQLLWPLVLAGGLGAASLGSRVNIGYRYLIPALPLLYVYLGQLAQPLQKTRLSVGLAGSAAACLVLLAGGLWLHPNYLAFFNLLAGGPGDGWRIVVDSNVDWGQDLQALAAFLEAEGVEAVNVSYLGTAPLAAYGIDGRLLAGWPGPPEGELHDRFYPPNPAPGTYALSVTQLQGVYLEDTRRFAWFQEREPDARVGYSMFVYDVAPSGPVAALALAGIPLAAIQPEDMRLHVGTNDVRPAWYDARSNFLWPAGDEVWLAVGEGHLPEDPLLQGLYASTGPVTAGEAMDGFRYRLYRGSEAPDVLLQPPFAAQGWTTEGVLGSEQWDEARQVLPGPALFGDQLRLLGYETASELQEIGAGEDLALLSVWLVEQPPAANLRLFVHVVDAAGGVVAQHDGLDVYLESLEADDRFAQLHTIPLPVDLPPGVYGLQIGAYDPETGARLPVATPAGTADRVLLRTFSVEAP